MRAPAVEGPFDLAIVAFNSLAYLTRSRTSSPACAPRAALLAPGGHFAFDLVMPRYDFLAEATDDRAPVVRVDADYPVPAQGLTRMVRTFADSFDPATQTLRSANTYQLEHEDGRLEHRLNEILWHIYFPRELELLLAAAGLDDRAALGRLRPRPVGPGLVALPVALRGRVMRLGQSPPLTDAADLRFRAATVKAGSVLTVAIAAAGIFYAARRGTRATACRSSR